MGEELKPCPFCGGPAKMISMHAPEKPEGERYRLVCNGLYDDPPTPCPSRVSGSPEQAAIAWNTRARVSARGAEPALRSALVAMKIASNLPGAAAEYDFSDAITAVEAALSAALSGMAEPVVWTRQRSLDRLEESGMLIAISGPGGDGYEVPLYVTPPASGLREEKERLRVALRRLVTTYAGFEDGDGNPCPDVAFGIATLQTEGK